MTSTVPGLLEEVADGVLRLTFDRPEVLNALSGEMAARVGAVLEEAVTRDDVRVVVISGRGGAFSTGADIAGEGAHARFDVRAMDVANRMIRGVVRLDKPVVAAVGGVAAGVGASLALACDLVVVARSAQLLLPFTRIGLMPDGGSTATVAASIGRARAMRMGLLAEPLTAQEAYDAGLATHLADDDAVDELVATLARRLAAGPPVALAATKRAVNAATLPHLEEALERERAGQTLLFGTADLAEGMAAFNERRRPDFRGE
ncbi:enoyl-CoA hydratase-related protein [Nocardioides nanhaiensis]|uniref:Enoyl-CoA hydratase n=1 Tax=Nocardioides nanhaiensis TaxID=1476871 RepID=A0ABP8W1I4_9ACTN